MLIMKLIFHITYNLLVTARHGSNICEAFPNNSAVKQNYQNHKYLNVFSQGASW